MDNEFPLWSVGLYPHHVDGMWVIAFDDDGQHWTSSDPGDDFFAPVPDYYDTEAGALAAIEVLKAWEAPVANDENCLTYDVLRATPEWAALVPHLPTAHIGNYDQEEFDDAEEMGMIGGLPGSRNHYLVMLAAGVKVRA